MAQGEFESQASMNKVIPEYTARPLAWGPLENVPSHAFYMCEFHDLVAPVIPSFSSGSSAPSDAPAPPSNELHRRAHALKHLDIPKPSAPVVASVLAQLHRDSSSPTGKFGFPVSTFKGYAPMDNRWCDRWEDWFSRQFRMDIRLEQSRRGPDPEMDRLFEEFAGKVIPRLLRPLQTGGRNIKPSLVHTDVWYGNIQRDRVSQKPLLFDASCVYGHHESELTPSDRVELEDGTADEAGSGTWHVQGTDLRLGPGVHGGIPEAGSSVRAARGF